MRLLNYRRSEIKFSDHRPVTATYTVEVEVFSPKKLQRALTFTNAEVEEHDIITDVGVGNGIGMPVLEEVSGYKSSQIFGRTHVHIYNLELATTFFSWKDS